MTVIPAPSHLPNALASIVGLTGGRRLLLAAFAGAIGTLAMPPVDCPPAMLIALPLLFLLARAARGFWHAFWAGVFWGTGHFITGLYWIVFAYLVPPADFALMGPPTVFGLAVLLALFVGVGCGLFRLLLGRLPAMLAATWRQVLVFAICFVIFEWLRGHVMTGFPWNQVGHAWSLSTAMSQSVAVFGIYGLSLLSLLVFTLPVAGRRGTAAALVLLAVMAGGGALRLAQDRGGEQPGVQLRVVQPNIAQSEKWLNALANAHFGKTLGLSSLPAETPPTIVIWPETAIAFPLERSPSAREAMTRVVPKDGYLLTGTMRMIEKPNGKRDIFNSLQALDQNGKVVTDYDKFHLVPLGEYIPLRNWLPLEDTVGRGSFESGPGPRTLRLQGMPPVTVLICYEIIFPGAVVDAKDRPQWILNITNDAWFGVSSGPYQHLANARIRAIEEGLPLVRSANTGISAVIDAYGRTLSRLDLEKTGVIDTGLPLALPPTLYARFGDWMFLLLLLAVTGLCLRRRQ
ncbi:MAG: lnt [Alphaproteobacteria bacterium]|jgi:apolipoprotein N-acyltransferase|nr:lnt [Alphaproteobacteria bacterium]